MATGGQSERAVAGLEQLTCEQVGPVRLMGGGQWTLYAWGCARAPSMLDDKN